MSAQSLVKQKITAKATLFKNDDPLLSTYTKIKEASNFQLDLVRAYKVENQATGWGCAVFPITNTQKFPEEFIGKNDLVSYFSVYYEMDNPQKYKPVICYTAGKVVNDYKQGIIVIQNITNTMKLSTTYGRNTSGVDTSLVTRLSSFRTFNTCIDGNVSDIKSVISAVSVNSCPGGNAFGCGFNAGYFLAAVSTCWFSKE